MNEIKNVVFATDLGESAQLALETMRFLWPKLDGHLTIMHVVPDSGFSDPPPTPEEETAALEEKQQQLEAIASELGGECEVVLLRGDVSRRISTYVNERGNIDLLVLGRHYYSRLQRLLTGVVADIIIKEVHCPVLRC